MFAKTVKQIEATKLQGLKATHIMLFGGSRSGKTFQNSRSLVVRAIKYPESRHLIARNTLKSVKNAIIRDTMPKMLKLCFPQLLQSFNNRNKSENFWELPNGSQIWFGGIGNPDEAEKILGTEYSTIFFNEVSELPYRSVLKVRTRLAQNIKGCKLRCYYDCNPPSRTHWAYREFIEGVNPFDTEQQIDTSDYASMLMNPVDNIKNLPTEYIKQLESLPELERNRFLLGLWSDQVYGAVFGTELAKIDNHIGSYSYNTQYPVYTGWDIGHSDDTAIWCYQVIDGCLYFIDCYHNNFEGLPHYIKWLESKPYKYATDFFPHDGSNTEWAWGRTRRAVATEDFKRNVVVLPRITESDQVSLVRTLLPKCYFNKKMCAYGIDGLRNCRYEYNEKLGNFKNTEMLHDEYSHIAKAFIYSCMGYDMKKKEVKYLTENEKQKAYEDKIDKILAEFKKSQITIDEEEL